MAKKKYYAVWAGRTTGIFDNWPAAEASVSGYPGAKYKGFSTLGEAELALSEAKTETVVGAVTNPTIKATAVVLIPATALDPLFDVHIFCDGGCDPNPGQSGSGIAMYVSGELSKLYHGLYNPNGTNNTAELNALLQAMLLAESEHASGHKVQILSDSTYAIKAMTEWGPGWKSSGRMAGHGNRPLTNRELVSGIFDVYCTIKDHVSIVHVRAHSGIEGNELADRMCTLAIRGKVTGFIPYEGMSVDELLAVDSC